MKEFFALLKAFDLRALFITPTKNSFLQFVRYVLVGGIATIVDWGFLFLLTDLLGIYHLLSAVIAFVVGLATNFLLSKLLVFKANTARGTPFVEFLGYTIIGIVGLGITELIMLLFTNGWQIHYMLSKVVSTIVVLVWNYLARKIILYKE